MVSPGLSSVPAKQAADHDAGGAGRQGLGDVARELDAAVGDDGDARLVRLLAAVHDRRDLRDARAGYDPGGADGAGPDADLDRIGARPDEVLGGFGRRDVAGHEVEIGILLLDGLDRVDNALGMAVGRVNDHDVDAGLQELGHALGIIVHADRSADPQPAQFVLAGIRDT